MNSEVLDGTGVSGVVPALERRLRIEVIGVTTERDFSSRCLMLRRSGTTLRQLRAIRWKGDKVALYIDDPRGEHLLTAQSPFAGNYYEEVRYFVADAAAAVALIGGDQVAYLANTARVADAFRGLTHLAAPLGEDDLGCMNQLFELGLATQAPRRIQWTCGSNVNSGAGNTPLGWSDDGEYLFFADKRGSSLTVIGADKLKSPKELQQGSSGPFRTLIGKTGIPQGASNTVWEIVPSPQKRRTALKVTFQHGGTEKSHVVFSDGSTITGAPSTPTPPTATPPKGSARRGGARSTSDRPPTAA